MKTRILNYSRFFLWISQYYYYICWTGTFPNLKISKNTKKMRTYISIQNEQVLEFEILLDEYDFLNDVVNIRERDFITDFIFEDLGDEEEITLEQLKKDLN